jgi:hypothetical protein
VWKSQGLLTCERAMQRGVTTLSRSYCSTSFARAGNASALKAASQKVCEIRAAQDAEIHNSTSEAEKAYIAQIDPSSQV